ncbi:MAG: trigger factor [Hyphomicrobiaceae bacterium]|nr:trigger factor [Hyphomicrobiaceae bacterium]
MQVTEIHAVGLMRQLQIDVAAKDINDRCDMRLDEISGTAEIRGFRKGKVPKTYLKKVYGRRLMAEVLQQVVEESSRKALTDRKERPASQPEINLPENQADIEGAFSGGSGFSYIMKYEVLPTINLIDFEKLNLERPVMEINEDDIHDKLGELAKYNLIYDVHADIAEQGDKLTIDFSGLINGEPFEGGVAENVELVIGQGGFIEGFEQGLKGAKLDEKRFITTVFPKDYPVEALREKQAIFEVTIKKLSRPRPSEINDDLAKSMGLNDLNELKDTVKVQLSNEYLRIARSKLKRQLLDALDQSHSFELPKSLCDGEFSSAWKELTGQMEKDGKSFNDLKKSESDLRLDYTKLAERRVRLGLIIGEVGDRFGISVSKDELREAIVQQARTHPGTEQQVFDFYENTPGAINQIRAPIFEEKVVDFLLGKSNVQDRKVSKSEFLSIIESDSMN